MENIDLTIASQLTNGGRSLNAIWSTKLPTNQKITLQYLASQLDFRGDFRESRWSPIRKICEATSISRSTIFDVLKKLEENGYIKREQRYENKTQLPTSYAITDKIFEEYYDYMTRSASRTTNPKL